MKKSEKEELLKFIDSTKFPVAFANYIGTVADTDVLKNYVNNIPTDKEDIKEVYAIRDLTTGDIIWNARGSAYKEFDDVKKKLKGLDSSKQYKIITYKLED